MPISPLSPDAIVSCLENLPGWKLEEGQITREFTFPNFRGSLDFVNRVGELAEEAGHHPDIDIRYNKVKLALVSHDAGGLTEKDFMLAEKINRLHPISITA